MRISDWSSDVCSSDLSEKEAVDGIRKLALVLGYTLNDPTQDAFRGSSLTGARFYELAGQISADLTRLVQIPWAGEAITQKDFALFSLKCIRRSEEHTSELQSLMRISYAVFCLKKTNKSEKHT